MRFILASLVVLALTFSNAFAALAPSDIRAWYPLAGNAHDASGNGLNGVLPGNGMDPQFVNDAERWVAARFDGVDDYISIAATELGFSSCSPGLEVAISFWIKTDGPGGAPEAQNVLMGASGVIEIVGTGSWSGLGGPDGGAFGINSGGGAGSAGRAVGALAGGLQDGQWHHLFLQWVDPDGNAGNAQTEAEIWIDGVLAEDANGATAFGGNCSGGTQNPTLGMGPGSGGGQNGFRYTGMMSDVVIFTRQLTSEEVLEAGQIHILFEDGFE